MKKTNNQHLELTSLDEVHHAIVLIKKRIALREEDLEMHLARLPEEGLKAIFQKIIPAFVGTQVIKKRWQLIKDIFGIISPFSTNRKEHFINIFKNVGWSSILKLAEGIVK